MSMNNPRYINGFWDRVEHAIAQSGKSKVQVAREAGFERKLLLGYCDGIHSSSLAAFCRVTGADANWLLGLSSDRYTEEAVKKLRTFWSGHAYRGTGDGIADECEKVLRGGR